MGVTQRIEFFISNEMAVDPRGIDAAVDHFLRALGSEPDVILVITREEREDRTRLEAYTSFLAEGAVSESGSRTVRQVLRGLISRVSQRTGGLPNRAFRWAR